MPDGNVETEVGSKQAVEAVPGAGHLYNCHKVHRGDHPDGDEGRHYDDHGEHEHPEYGGGEDEEERGEHAAAWPRLLVVPESSYHEGGERESDAGHLQPRPAHIDAHIPDVSLGKISSGF